MLPPVQASVRQAALGTGLAKPLTMQEELARKKRAQMDADAKTRGRTQAQELADKQAAQRDADARTRGKR